MVTVRVQAAPADAAGTAMKVRPSVQPSAPAVLAGHQRPSGQCTACAPRDRRLCAGAPGAEEVSAGA